MWLRSVFMVLLLLGGKAWAAGTVVVLGDSLSAAYGMPVEQGWVSLLERRLEQNGCPYHVVNASISGETTSGGLSRLPGVVEAHSPDLVIIELGGNDGLRGLSLDQMRANLAAMIEAVKAIGAGVLLVGMQMPPNYGPTYTERFQSVYHELAERYGVALVPFLLEGVGGNDALMQPDRIHASAEAQPHLLTNVWDELAPLLEGCAVEGAAAAT